MTTAVMGVSGPWFLDSQLSLRAMVLSMSFQTSGSWERVKAGILRVAPSSRLSQTRWVRCTLQFVIHCFRGKAQVSEFPD